MMSLLLRQTVLMFVALTLITGVAYPLAMTAIAQVLFAHQANGSLIVRNGTTIGSELIGQQFDDARYFWGRPSATSPIPYNGAASTGSNFGPTNPAQLDAVRSRVDSVRNAHPDQRQPVPVDLVTASGSGLDPHISPAAAAYQVRRVARARKLKEEQVRELVASLTVGRTLGVLGEPRVNVLELNLALDDLGRWPVNAPRSERYNSEEIDELSRARD
jgi:K+-transporting ATPase ATPase C chain